MDTVFTFLLRVQQPQVYTNLYKTYFGSSPNAENYVFLAEGSRPSVYIFLWILSIATEGLSCYEDKLIVSFNTKMNLLATSDILKFN